MPSLQFFKFTPGGIPYTELVEGHKESYSPDADHAVKVCDVLDTQRKGFITEARGYSTWDNEFADAGGGIGANSWRVINRRLPLRHSSLNPHLVCTGADTILRYSNHKISPLTLDSLFDYARVSLTFTSPRYQVRPNAVARASRTVGELCRYCERHNQLAADNIPVPSGSFRWVTGNHDAIQEGGVPKSFPVRELTYTLHEIPGSLMPYFRISMELCVGKVNGSAFDRTNDGGGLDTGYPPGTLLLIGAEEEQVKAIDRFTFSISPPADFYVEPQFRIKLKFLYRNNGSEVNADGTATFWGWNYLYRGPSFTPQFQLCTANGTAAGQRIYSEADHMDVLRFRGYSR